MTRSLHNDISSKDILRAAHDAKRFHNNQCNQTKHNLTEHIYLLPGRSQDLCWEDSSVTSFLLHQHFGLRKALYQQKSPLDPAWCVKVKQWSHLSLLRKIMMHISKITSSTDIKVESDETDWAEASSVVEDEVDEGLGEETTVTVVATAVWSAASLSSSTSSIASPEAPPSSSCSSSCVRVGSCWVGEGGSSSVVSIASHCSTTAATPSALSSFWTCGASPVVGCWSRWYWGMRGTTEFERLRQSGQRNSCFSTSNEVGCRALKGRDSKLKHGCY